MTSARLLFVDDEPRILEGIENMLFDREDWELVFATSGEEALRILHQDSKFDALITDMRMPGMDGLQLLQEVVKQFPHLIRIVLSGDAEKQRAMTAITIAHQYLGKPCEENVLIAAIERALRVGTVVKDDELRRKLGMLSETPHENSRLRRIYQLASRDDASLPEVSRAVAADVGLATKLVQAASSAIFGATPVSTVGAAVARIGLDGVRALALAMDVYGRLATAIPGAFAQREHQSLLLAGLASSITTVHGEAERAYLCGLLHDLGAMTLLVQLPERANKCLAAARRREGDLRELERAEFGIDHAILAAEILELFGMHDIAEVIRFHDHPSTAGKPAQLDALGALHLACAVLREQDGEEHPLDEDFVEALGPLAEMALFRARRMVRSM